MVQKSRPAFTLIELLVVIAVIAVLAALLFPVMTRATLRAKVARVHSDLRQVAIAIEAYNQDCGGLPPVRSTCTGSSKYDYYEIPTELTKMRYLSTAKMYDPFNRTRDDGEQIGRTYKYIAINWGYTNGNKGHFSMWIPRDYPSSREDCLLYYKYAGRIQVFDKGKSYPKDPPIMWAVWSVGPGGDPGQVVSGEKMHPMPRDQWYPRNMNGVIARFGDGRTTP